MQGLQTGPGPDRLPRLDITVRLRLAAVLDLMDTQVLAHLELQGDDLWQEWLPLNVEGKLAPTQILARAVLDTTCYGAIRSPSARVVSDPEHELDVFPEPQSR